jgi:glycopeptide antibiotics resistance protein
VRATVTLARIDWFVKLALIALLVHGVVDPDLPQYQGKGMGWRLLTYPLSTLVVPVIWFLWTRSPSRRERAGAYPYLIDICVVAPFLIDTAGNTANLYDTIDWWDDLMHVVTWIPWVTAVGLALRRLPLGRLNVAALTIGFGAVTHIIWEVLEYLTFVRGNPSEAATAYEDTIGDLVASLSGSIIGAILVATVLWNLGAPESAPPSVVNDAGGGDGVHAT